MNIFLRQPTDFELGEAYAKSSSSKLTYQSAGSTAGTMPKGFCHDSFRCELGKGKALYNECCAYLDRWDLQRSMGFKIYPPESRVIQGITVVLSLSILKMCFLASCRVVYVVDEQTRHGFAYGTLPNHPECGEEYFGVFIDHEDTVQFEIRAFSKPAKWYARFFRPLTRRIQLAAMNRYQQKIREFASSRNAA